MTPQVQCEQPAARALRADLWTGYDIKPSGNVQSVLQVYGESVVANQSTSATQTSVSLLQESYKDSGCETLTWLTFQIGLTIGPHFASGGMREAMLGKVCI